MLVERKVHLCRHVAHIHAGTVQSLTKKMRFWQKAQVGMKFQGNM